MFPGEHDLEEARKYTRNLLEKSRSINEKMVPIYLNKVKVIKNARPNASNNY